MNNGPAIALDHERDAFEHAYVRLDDASPFAIEIIRKLRRSDGGYYSASADFAWMGWKIGRAHDAATHPDDIAVDRFAAAMKAKLAKKRAEGRGGWGDCDLVSAADLSAMLREHVDKGDPLDVGAFAMMLHQRGDKVEPASLEYLVEATALAHAEGRKCGLEIARHAYEAHDRAGRDWVGGSLYDTLNREGAERVQAAANRMGAAPLAATVDDLLGALRAILIGQEGARERGQLAITRASARQP